MGLGTGNVAEQVILTATQLVKKTWPSRTLMGLGTGNAAEQVILTASVSLKDLATSHIHGTGYRYCY